MDREQVRRDAEQVPLTRASAGAAERQMEAEIARLNPELGKRVGILVLELDATKRALEQAERERDEERKDAQRWKEMYDSEHGRLRQAEREVEARLAADTALVEALNRIAERQDVDVNGEYVIHDQPVLSGADASLVARAALAAYEQAQGEKI